MTRRQVLKTGLAVITLSPLGVVEAIEILPTKTQHFPSPELSISEPIPEPQCSAGHITCTKGEGSKDKCSSGHLTCSTGITPSQICSVGIEIEYESQKAGGEG